ncbi:MAG TPA: hypothetical protein VKB14_01150, partial [Actinomycetales bacterium]|nr:hypothetical protein [Actinomycetales bacterium]
AELGRLRRRRLVVTLLLLGLAGVLVGMAVIFGTHSTDVAGARTEATRAAQEQAAANQEFEPGCRQDPSIPEADKDIACSGPTADDLFQDPRFVAERGLPEIAISVAVTGALVAALVGATAVGADWSSRAMITLLTWEPRRLRLLGTRLAAVALVCAAAGVVAQLLALGLGALTAQLRGTWAAPGADGIAGLVPHAHFWRDLLSLQLRGVVLMVLAGVLAASVTTVTRHTGGLLGLLFAWFAVAENAVRILGSDRGWPRWLLTENITAFLLPGGRRLESSTDEPTGALQPETLVSNLDALLYLGAVTAGAAVLAGVLLRRRDL